jgi:hypothetical protein
MVNLAPDKPDFRPICRGVGIIKPFRTVVFSLWGHVPDQSGGHVPDTSLDDVPTTGRTDTSLKVSCLSRVPSPAGDGLYWMVHIHGSHLPMRPSASNLFAAR